MGVLADLLRRLAPEPSESAKQVHRDGSPDTRFRAVSIRPGEHSCGAARQLGHLRFLGAKAPRLPLPECDAATCNCCYAHYSDRRSGRDRRAKYDWAREREIEVVNRRSSHGRRATDGVA
jgi:hypothetical protein